MIGIDEVLHVIGEAHSTEIKEMDTEAAEFVAHLLAVEFTPCTRVVVIRWVMIEEINTFLDQRKLYPDQRDVALAGQRRETLKRRDLAGIDIRRGERISSEVEPYVVRRTLKIRRKMVSFFCHLGQQS